VKVVWKPQRESRTPWPIRLRDNMTTPVVTLRALQVDDEEEWQHLRRDNAAHVAPWEPTLPPGVEGRSTGSFRSFVREFDAEARADRVLPWVIEVEGHLVGQVHVFGIVRGAQQSAAIGYWLAASAAGQGIATRAVALAIDHALGPAQLHRIEVNIRLDNERSLALARRLGLRDEGVRKGFLHIDGAWRDHRSFAVTAEEWQARTHRSHR
jgi:[ribosomal protein S5]-alanine N-acetyltransferase